MAFLRGSRVGPYEIVMRLGVGGMGEVYRARDPRLNREVAIKVLNEETARDRDRLRRFVSEAKAASALNHPNILTVHEIGETESGPFIVTELVEGQTVRDALRDGPLSIGQALDIEIQTAEGIAKAHESGIVHRDLKPENLMVTPDGYVKILDFGLAKLVRTDSVDLGAGADQASTATGMILGTAGYLSPEQLRGAQTDARSDLFALGVVLYEMLTGNNPFRRDNAADTFSAILRDEPPPLTARLAAIPGELESEVRKALSKKPEDRPASARQFASDLKRLRSRMDSGMTATTILPPSPATRSRFRRAALLMGVLALAALATLLVRRSRVSGAPGAVDLPPNDLAVAVLPVANEAQDPDLDRAGIGRILSDAFVQILSDIPRVYVVSQIRLNEVARSQGRSLADASRDASFAAKLSQASGANAMLSGRLSRLGKTYILDAELTRLPDTLLGKFQANSQQVDQLLPELTGGISRKIQAKLGSSHSTPGLDRVATTSLRAYEHFVRGYDLQAEGDFGKSVPELLRAVEIDPEMGLAWSFLGCGYSFAGDDARARAAQERAEKLLDRVNQKERRWIELNGVWVKSKNSTLFRKEAERYIRDYPDDREGYLYAGLAAEWLEGNCGEAIPWYEKAYRLTPAFYPITKGIVDCRLKMKQPDEAVAALRRYLEIPSLSPLGRSQAQFRLTELQK